MLKRIFSALKILEINSLLKVGSVFSSFYVKMKVEDVIRKGEGGSGTKLQLENIKPKTFLIRVPVLFSKN